ncbi:MAG: arylsulfatase, partial [Haloferula sp.]
QLANILFIITDDLGYGDLSCYGQKQFKTPVLDGLAGNGLRFTDFYSGSTVCAPARCSLMTGRDQGHATIRGNGAYALRPDPQDLTVATLLKGAGYRTGMIGKSCVTGNTQNPEVVLAKGFDVFYGTTSHVDGHFRFPKFVYDQTEKVTFEGNKLHEGTDYDAELYTKRAEKFIDEQPADQPFFLLLSYPIPHASVLAPEGFAEKAAIPNDIDYVRERYHYSNVKGVKSNYAGMTMAIDAYVGRLMESLKAKGVADDTLIMFTSDNGSHFEGGYKPKMLDSNAPLRGGKRDLYEGGIRVPLIAHWPNGIKKPGEPDAPFAFWDFLPTACELAGVKVPGQIEGVSMAPTLTGAGEQKLHDKLYWEFHEQRGRRAVREGDWKVVQYDLKLEKPGKPQLFNLAEDIGEKNDLAAKHPDRVKAMVQWMDEHRTPCEWFPMKALDDLSK